MAGRRFLITVVLLAATLHAASISRTLLPAQDGLKFIRVARQFQRDSWPDVVRETDQHPLYPALIAAAEPVVRSLRGPGPDTWRIAAQAIAAIAALALIVPLFGLTRALFDERIARLAVAIYVLLPVPAEIGHDTLSDSLGLLAIVVSLRCGSLALAKGDWRPALAAGLAGGIGYLARPEVILAPAAVGLAGLWPLLRKLELRRTLAAPVLPALGLSALVVVGGYALVKGQVTEKLALRHAASLGSQTILTRTVPQWLPRGLDDRRWDFSPKEETERTPVRGLVKAAQWVAIEWWDELCWGFAIMAVWGLVRQRFILGLCRRFETEDAGRCERRVLAVFAVLFLAALLRHATTLGYLSGRHTLPLVLVSLPWAAAGTFVCLRGLAVKLYWPPRTAWTCGALAAGLVVTVMVAYQLRPAHTTRRGHWLAGRWLAEHAGPTDVVLDTRGWARFLSQTPGYDCWHIRQALTDRQLSYVVVGHEELNAKSPRAQTLVALLAHAATPVEDFPAFACRRDVGVRLYRFHQPASWEGLVP